jgi:hypothetical protein
MTKRGQGRAGPGAMDTLGEYTASDVVAAAVRELLADPLGGPLMDPDQMRARARAARVAASRARRRARKARAAQRIYWLRAAESEADDAA